jgi:hypothetical protein
MKEGKSASTMKFYKPAFLSLVYCILWPIATCTFTNVTNSFKSGWSSVFRVEERFPATATEHSVHSSGARTVSTEPVRHATDAVKSATQLVSDTVLPLMTYNTDDMVTDLTSAVAFVSNVVASPTGLSQSIDTPLLPTPTFKRTVQVLHGDQGTETTTLPHILDRLRSVVGITTTFSTPYITQTVFTQVSEVSLMTTTEDQKPYLTGHGHPQVTLSFTSENASPTQRGLYDSIIEGAKFGFRNPK